MPSQAFSFLLDSHFLFLLALTFTLAFMLERNLDGTLEAFRNLNVPHDWVHHLKCEELSFAKRY